MQKEFFPEKIREVFDFLRGEINPKKPFLAGQRTTTYGMLLERVGKLTAFFREHGIRPGNRVVIASKDHTESCLLLLSLLKNGITAVLLDPDTRLQRATSILGKVQPAMIFADKEILEIWRPVEAMSPVVITQEAESKGRLFNKLLGRNAKIELKSDTYPALLKDLPAEENYDKIPPETEAYVLFTSGTTSEPKGVTITHRNLFSHLATLTRQFGYDTGTRIMNSLFLFHADGLVQGPLVTAYNGASLYRAVEFSIQNLQEYLDSIYKYRITHLICVPTMLSLICKFGGGSEEAFRTPDFRFVISSASPLDTVLWKNFQDRFGTRVVNFYGMTETVTGGIFCGPSKETFRMGSIGKPVDCMVRIVDEKGQETGIEQAGELLMKGDHIMKGYFGDSVRTSEVLTDGWFHTGDLVRSDAEGFIWIKGRKKSLIISGGVNVLPEEVNEVLMRMPGIAESATFGVEDETWGERVVSCVVPDQGATITEPDIIEKCRKELEPTKVPHKVYVMADLPRGSSGKIKLDELKDRVIGLGGIYQEDTSQGIHERIVDIAARTFKVPAESLSLRSEAGNTPGWDSLTHLEFISELENELDVQFSTLEIMKIRTLEDAENIINSKLTA
jgi:long-chain acyl-CoA synthetase